MTLKAKCPRDFVHGLRVWGVDVLLKLWFLAFASEGIYACGSLRVWGAAGCGGA